MYLSKRSLLTLLAFTGLSSSQFVSTPDNFTSKTGYAGIGVRYKEVPAGICEQDPNVKSYSGFADVEENQHIFWWFFEARVDDPTTAPLTIWINGGPGSSSMIGLFQELGPCGVDYDGNVYNNPYSWSNVSNMIFIDQPTTTGLSYSIPVPGYTDADTGNIIVLPNATCPDYAQDAGCGTYSVPDVTLTANSTPAAAPNFWKTLQGFTGAFPQYSSNGVYFTTESYGGHYAPIFSNYILQQNQILQNSSSNDTSSGNVIDLRGVMIGNGWYDPILQYAAYYNFTGPTPGNTYDVPDLPWNDTLNAQVSNAMYGDQNCLTQLLQCNAYPYATNSSDGQGNAQCGAADNWCYQNVEDVYDRVLNRDEYDVREMTPDPFPYSFYIDYLNNATVQAAIGAFVNYSESSSTVGTAFAGTGDDARELGITDAMDTLIESNLTVVMYFGDADFNCNWIGGQAVSMNLSAVPKYTDGTAGFENISTSDNITHGVVKSAGKYSFVRIYESGHEVPFYQPLVALTMLQRVLDGLDIATGTMNVSSDYITSGPVESIYYEGGSTVQNETVPIGTTYNTTTNAPDAYNSSDDSSSGGSKMKRSVELWKKDEYYMRTPLAYGKSSRFHVAKKRSEKLRRAALDMKKRGFY